MNLRDQLLTIRAERGTLTPQSVLDTARPKGHPLHDRFEWDNRIAGEAYRRDQAHRLIQSVRVSYIDKNNEQRTTRAFVAIPSDSPQPTYEMTETVATDPVLHQMMVAQLEREWRQLSARYGHLTEFMELVATAAESMAA